MRMWSLDIKNFKGFRELKVEFPHLVTLIAGKNNSGKSTLLEAVELVACASDPLSLGRILEHREYQRGKLEDLTTFFHGRNDSSAATLACNFGEEVVRHVVFFKGRQKSGEVAMDLSASGAGGFYVLGSFDSEGEKDAVPNLVRFYDDATGALQWSAESEGDFPVWRFEYCTAGNEPRTVDVVSKLKQTCSEDWLIEFLKEIDPNVRDITTDRDQIIVRLENPRAAIPLQLMGDGVNKVVKILGLMCSVGEGGVICIDEVDNGLHHTVMRKLISLVLRVATEKKIQVLMTTHSIEMLRHISASISAEAADFGFLRLVHCADGTSKAFSYAPEAFAESIKGGVEVR